MPKIESKALKISGPLLLTFLLIFFAFSWFEIGESYASSSRKPISDHVVTLIPNWDGHGLKLNEKQKMKI